MNDYPTYMPSLYYTSIGFKNQFSFLSNFYPVELQFHGQTYLCAEAAYQASKFEDPRFQESFTRLNGFEAKKRGRFDHPSYDQNWDNRKLGIMKEILDAKFSNPRLRKLLLETGNLELVEINNWGDKFWGVCNFKGYNHLGNLLMDLRKSFEGKMTLDNSLRLPIIDIVRS